MNPSDHASDLRYNPWHHAVRLKLRIIETILTGNILGYWDARSRTIVLDKRLGHAEQRSTLAHEIVHAERGDEPCASRWHEDKQEAAVHAIAAERLILVEDLALAVLLHEHEIDQADLLEVDLSTLRVRLAGLTDAERGILAGRSLGA